MRNHIQGVALLLIMGIALMGTLQLARPAFSGAMGSDDAEIDTPGEVAASADSLTADIGDVSLEEQRQLDEPLNDDELFTLQGRLADEGFLDSRRDVDGIMGPTTRGAIETAKASYGITEASNRQLLVYLEGILAERESALAPVN